VVPIESLIQGAVTETLDSLFRYAGQVTISDMLVLPIAHALGALEGSGIRRILSKDQALQQCSLYLAQHYPHAELIETPSTTAAMEMIVQQGWRDAAAIGSESALRQYGLQLLERGIGNIPDNKTKFAVLGDRNHVRTGTDATSFVIYPHRDRIGLLQDILHIISRENGLNLSSIHSRPDTKGGFRFYVEVEGHIEDAAVANSLAAMERALTSDDVEVRVFGAYPRRMFNAPRLHTIGLIGGTGQMGRWFTPFFEAAGYQVLSSGRRTSLTYEMCIVKSDAVIINVPISHTVEVIRQIGHFFRPGQLMLDNTSIKTQPVAAMLDVAPEGVEVLGMHTVFGPNIPELRRQNVIFTNTSRSGELAREFEGIFYKYGATITHTTPEYHDRQMALHQNLEHFTKIVLAEVLRTQFGSPAVMATYSSPNSRLSLITMGRVLKGDPQLYAEIQTQNLQGAGMIQEYLRIAGEIGQALICGDASRFTQAMTQNAEAFGPGFLNQAVDISNAIQRTISGSTFQAHL
ncbi:MAG: prephenate dehydrogenase/arogenate dehydrogenase family protein, partial [Candidatus Entotheonellia bacterium]